MPPAPRKAVKRLTANVDRVRHDLVKRGDKLATDVRKRAERLGTDLQKRIEGVVTPLTHRLDVASRADVDRLRKRLHELERRMEAKAHHAHTACLTVTRRRRAAAPPPTSATRRQNPNAVASVCGDRCLCRQRT